VAAATAFRPIHDYSPLALQSTENRTGFCTFAVLTSPGLRMGRVRKAVAAAAALQGAGGAPIIRDSSLA